MPSLSAYISGPYTGSAGSSLDWTATALGGVPPFSYTWRVDGFYAGSGSSLSYSFGMDGSYFVQLTVSDSASQVVNTSRMVTIGSCSEDLRCEIDE